MPTSRSGGHSENSERIIQRRHAQAHLAEWLLHEAVAIRKRGKSNISSNVAAQLIRLKTSSSASGLGPRRFGASTIGSIFSALPYRATYSATTVSLEVLHKCANHNRRAPTTSDQLLPRASWQGYHKSASMCCYKSTIAHRRVCGLAIPHSSSQTWT